MSSPSAEASLVRQLVDAQRRSTHTVDASVLPPLDRAAAYRVQAAVMSELGETVGALKTTVLGEGIGGVAAPFYSSRVGMAPGFTLPSAAVMGLELEVGLVLGKDIASDPELTEAEVEAAVDHYVTGIEVVGTRYADWKAGSLTAAVADNILAYGYVIGRRRALGNRLDGFNVSVSLAGLSLYSAPAKHGFDTVLSTLVAYGRDQNPAYPLKVGTIVTTGSLCGLVPTSGPGHVIGSLGDDVVEFDLW